MSGSGWSASEGPGRKVWGGSGGGVASSAILYRATGPYDIVPHGPLDTDFDVHFRGTGDAPPPGEPTAPLTGLLSYGPTVVEGGETHWTTIIVRGVGMLSAQGQYSSQEVYGAGHYVQTGAIYLNGVPLPVIASKTTDLSGLALVTFDPGDIVAAPFAVVSGDVVKLAGTWHADPTNPNPPTIPAGVGDVAERLTVTGVLR